MNRVVTTEIDGQIIEMLFTLEAMEKICDKYGSVSEMFASVLDEENAARRVRKALEIIEILNRAAGGSFSADKAIHQQNPFEIMRHDYVYDAFHAINIGSEQTVEVEDDLKNGEAAQG